MAPEEVYSSSEKADFAHSFLVSCDYSIRANSGFGDFEASIGAVEIDDILIHNIAAEKDHGLMRIGNHFSYNCLKPMNNQPKVVNRKINAKPANSSDFS